MCYRIPYLISTGLIDFWIKKYLPQSVKCMTAKNTTPASNRKKYKKRPLKLVYVYSAFVIWCFGVCISLLVFLCELSKRNVTNSRRILPTKPEETVKTKL
jgi:hypothetical protein